MKAELAVRSPKRENTNECVPQTTITTEGAEQNGLSRATSRHIDQYSEMMLSSKYRPKMMNFEPFRVSLATVKPAKHGQKRISSLEMRNEKNLPVRNPPHVTKDYEKPAKTFRKSIAEKSDITLRGAVKEATDQRIRRTSRVPERPKLPSATVSASVSENSRKPKKLTLEKINFNSSEAKKHVSELIKNIKAEKDKLHRDLQELATELARYKAASKKNQKGGVSKELEFKEEPLVNFSPRMSLDQGRATTFCEEELREYRNQMEAMFENILSINKSASKYFNEEMLQDKSFTEGYVNFSSDLFEAYSFITSKSLFDPILLFSEQRTSIISILLC
eukprot:TRINITY_DN5341_c0_g1_i1.p1 TRINITY_DN5341_c0_g1~~TRINITY_DN5341_c0_g1_i1.p1  ORF type:complete len:334 (+),score=58.48 TRINITY_DN5341_c0_g1_i1:147-1148(+)